MSAKPGEVKKINRTANVWPAGCHSPSSCSRNGRCMYVGCEHDGRDIKALAASAVLRARAAETLATKELVVEAELVRRVESHGGKCVKMKAVGRRGFPDRLVAMPGAILVLVELKRPRGGILSIHQKQWRSELAALGVVVEVVKDSADIDRLMQRLLRP